MFSIENFVPIYADERHDACRLVALNDHCHAAKVCWICNIAFDIEPLRTSPIGEICAVHWRVNAGDHVLARAHRIYANRRHWGIRISSADTAVKGYSNE